MSYSLPGYDAWRLSGPPEPDEVEMTRECGWEDENDETGELRICAFEGPVTVYVMDGVSTWDCPDCGHEHQIDDMEAEFGPDPDAAWDSRFDRDDEDD